MRSTWIERTVENKERIEGKFCWGIMKADVTISYEHIFFQFAITDLTIWKTCECFPINFSPTCANAPDWTRVSFEMGFLGAPTIIKMYAELCMREHPCSRSYSWRDCNHAYLEKCETDHPGPATPIGSGSIQLPSIFGRSLIGAEETFFFTQLDEGLATVETRMRDCFDKIGPCKERAVP